MPQEIIDRVHFIVKKQGSLVGVIFLRVDGTEFEDVVDAEPLSHENVHEGEDVDNNINHS